MTIHVIPDDLPETDHHVQLRRAVIASTVGGPAPLIATTLLAMFGSGYAIAAYILFCAIVSIVATAFLPDYTNRDISQEHA